MELLLWVVSGGIIGWLASHIANGGECCGARISITVGVVGAVLGGLILNYFEEPALADTYLYSILVAVCGAVILLNVVRVYRRI